MRLIQTLCVVLVGLLSAAQALDQGRSPYWAALQRDPQDAQANLLYGEGLVDDGAYAKAIPYLQKASALDSHGAWIRAWALNYLGRCYFAAGDYAGSRKALLESARMGATENVTKKSNWYLHLFGMDDLFKTWDVQASEHFIFHFQTPSVLADHADFIKEREDAFAAIAAFFDDTRLPLKIHYFVWNSKADARKSVGFELGFAVPEHGVIQTSFDNETPGHETTHIIAHYFAGAPKRTMLINEGIAVHLNQKHWDNLELARKRWRSDPKGRASIKDLWSGKPLDSYHYPLAGAFAAHLLQWGGKEKFLNLIRHQSYEDALKIYGPGLDTAIHDFEAKLRR
ncbi:MAG: tetratricopeptide repeat protein [Elusimicrobia bacterium]|nr:tetratricopeptide repeat protein [Elusimicrobiota bacterium]